jgi:hypothetical protein
MDVLCLMSGGEPLNYQWTGNLAFPESFRIELPESNFNVLNVDLGGKQCSINSF